MNADYGGGGPPPESNSYSSSKTPKPNYGCCLAIIFLVLVIGTIYLFPWAQTINITPYPHINGILVSIGLILLAGFLFFLFMIITSTLLYWLRDVIKWLLIIIAVTIVVEIVYVVIQWLFSH